MHTCGNISISEILFHYHDMENFFTIIDISIILHITTIEQPPCSTRVPYNKLTSVLHYTVGKEHSQSSLLLSEGFSQMLIYLW